MKNVFYVLIGVMAGFLFAGVLFFISRAPVGTPIVLQPAPTQAPIAVHVIGAVARPGLYKFPEGARTQDAIDAAGGALAQANADSLNLAALLTDGQQLNVPYKDGSAPSADSAAPAVELPGATAPPAANTGDLININTATLEELMKLPDIGKVTAQKIIDYRDQNGPFAMIEDVMNVSGIGPATFEKIKDLITVY
jgi:competence protein ComEA